MPRRTVLSSSEREGLFALPDNQKDLIQQYTFSESDLSIIRQHRGAANRLGFAIQLCYMRYRSFENQRYRASGLNLVIAAIVLWNTVYLERVIQHLKDIDQTINENLLKHLSPLAWEHINLTGDYVWRQSKVMEKGEFRPLQRQQNP